MLLFTQTVTVWAVEEEVLSFERLPFRLESCVTDIVSFNKNQYPKCKEFFPNQTLFFGKIVSKEDKIRPKADK
jgi:hypothetical protein